MLGCAKVEHLSVQWLREVLYLNHHGLLCSGCSTASLSEVCDTDWHVLLWENQLDLLVPSHLGTCLGFLELKAQASSLEAIAESVVTSPPASITDWWTTQLSISGKTTFVWACTDILQHWATAQQQGKHPWEPGLGSSVRVTGPAPVTGAGEQDPLGWWQQPPCRWQASGQRWWHPDVCHSCPCGHKAAPLGQIRRERHLSSTCPLHNCQICL